MSALQDALAPIDAEIAILERRRRETIEGWPLSLGRLRRPRFYGQRDRYLVLYADGSLHPSVAYQAFQQRPAAFRRARPGRNLYVWDIFAREVYDADGMLVATVDEHDHATVLAGRV